MSEVTFQEKGDSLVISIAGRLDMETSEPVSAQIAPRLEGKKHVVFELAGLEYLSSYGLRMLLTTARELNKRYAMLSLAAVPDPILHVLKSSGLAKFFAIHETAEAALASDKRPENGDLDKVL